ncbi:hypothetical protein Taro_036625 [Colocasia esculenta]|uniref:very-long-chain 3-oxoacyl-CoA synthase n=1 Tax=Colocasia esculenta TaxID=4460 RepID=A0A843W218_COLES|nr:hypothetical protein [Colocasia esculenta]
MDVFLSVRIVYRFAEEGLEDNMRLPPDAAAPAAANSGWFPERREAEGPPTPARLYATMRWWLVEHPAVASFEWNPLRTWGASSFSLPALSSPILPSPSSFAPSCTAALPPSAAALSNSSPPLIHNAFLLLLSLAIAIGYFLATDALSLLALLLPPPAASLPTAPRLSFLHIYHHAVVVVMCYLWLTVWQSLLPVALVTNATVHVVMYGYYLCSSLGRRWPPRWKRAVTSCQIVQFYFSSSTLECLKASTAPAPTLAPGRPGPSFTRTPPTVASLHLLVVFGTVPTQHSVVAAVVSEQES